MAYIESHQSLGNHPKTKRAARLLGVPRVAVIGHLHCLWWWALEYAEDGDLIGFTDAEIAEEAMWDGDPTAFVIALVEAGFLDGSKRIHDWEDYTGRLVAQREGNRDRQRRFRQRQKVDPAPNPEPEEVEEAITVTSPLPVTVSNGATVPDPTVPNRNKPNQDDGGLPPNPPDPGSSGVDDDDPPQPERTPGQVYALVDAFATGKGLARGDIAGKARLTAYRALAAAPPGAGPAEVMGCTAYLMTDPFWDPPGKLKPQTVVDTLAEWMRRGRPAARLPPTPLRLPPNGVGPPGRGVSTEFRLQQIADLKARGE